MGWLSDVGDFLLGSKPGRSTYEIGGGAQGDWQSMMMRRARGIEGPSAAELMMRQGMDRQVAAGRSMAASMPGVSPGMGMRMAGQREAGAMSQVGQQTGVMRAQEQAQAQQMLGQWLQAQEQLRLQQELYNLTRQRQGGMLGPLLGAGGAALGGYLGGPAGAAAGGQAGGALGGGFGGSGPGYGYY